MSDLVAKARWVRQELVKMRVPLPSCLSCVEILVALYYGVKRPGDICIISKGHGAASRYPILEDLGFIPPGSMKEYRKPGGLLKLYAEPEIPETWVPCASLGIGFGVAAGMAMADPARRVFVVIGDGESYEGAIWETAMFAAHYKLTNLTVILDRNMHSVMGLTEENLAQEPVAEKWRAFGWTYTQVDCHDVESLITNISKKTKEPYTVIARTVKGKGVSFLEDVPNSHSKVLTE